MDHILLRQYRASEVFSVDHPASESLRTLREMPKRERSKIRLVKGHYAYGLHELFPQEGNYFTLLRNPISRLISYYFYAKRTPEHYLHRIIFKENFDVSDLIQRKLTLELDNDQVRRVSGVGDTVKFGDCTVEMLELAKQNIAENFAVTGFTERFDESLLLIQDYFGWKNVFYVRKNVAKSRPRRDTLPGNQIAAIREANVLDIKLYRWTQEHIERQIQRLDSFQRKLMIFKALNTLYSVAYWSREQIRGVRV
jgi:hypothetical protein